MGKNVVIFWKAIANIISVVIEKDFPLFIFLYRLNNSLVKCLVEHGVLYNECLLFISSTNSST